MTNGITNNKLSRQIQKIFASTSGTNQLAAFGSMISGTPIYTDDIATLQNDKYTQGWNAAVARNTAPFLQEFNGVQYALSYQIAYLLQKGIPEWSENENYFANSYCQYNGTPYISLTDNNIGNNPSSDNGINWKIKPFMEIATDAQALAGVLENVAINPKQLQTSISSLQTQIDAITASSDVTDVVGTYAQLQSYNTSSLSNNSIIKVLSDETQENATAYYRWTITDNTGKWELIGQEGPYYTIEQVDNNFIKKTDFATSTTAGIIKVGDGLSIATDGTLKATASAPNEATFDSLGVVTLDTVNQSKALTTGNVSSDPDVLADIVKYKHSLFDFLKITVVGSPTIVDGVVSGFNNSNYIRTNGINFENTFEIITPVFNSIVPTDGNIHYLINSDTLKVWVGSGSGQVTIRLTIDGQNYDTYLTIFCSPTNNMQLKIVYNGLKYYVYYKDITHTQWTLTPNQPTLTNAINLNNVLFLGWHSNNNYVWLGSIDLKHFSITVDGKEVYNCLKTGIDAIKPNDFTIVGNPVISDDGILTDGTTANYIKIPNQVFAQIGNKSWKLEWRGVVPSFGASGKYAFGYNYGNTNSFISVGTFNSNKQWFYRVVTNVDNKPAVTAEYPAINLNGGEKYYSCIEFVPDIGYVCYLETEQGISATKTINVTTPLAPQNNDLYVGYNLQDGSIDINTIKLYIENNLIYQSCLRIPYTQSKTGSKIADVTYRDRVQDMYEQYGYAPYYTLQEDNKSNFTIAGSPVIINESASGFSNNDYLVINNLIFNNDWEVQFEFTTGADITGRQIIACASGGNTISYFNNLGIYLNNNNLTLSINTTNGIKQATLAVASNTTYSGKIQYKNSIYSFIVNGQTLNEFNDEALLAFAGENVNFNIGQYAYKGSYYSGFKGSVNLNKTSVIINGVNNPAIIKPNYTLPMGEIYGLNEKLIDNATRPLGVPVYRFDNTIYDDEIRLEGAEVKKGLYPIIEQKLAPYCKKGSTDNTIILPNFKNRVLWGSADLGYVEAGLPNITGTVTNVRSVNGAAHSYEGVFYDNETRGQCDQANGGNYPIDISLDASRFNPIYGNSDTVQPPAIKVRWVARYK